ncbi:MAG TPA: hypothetical protein VGI39_15225 [Polyangiaceae bacterium]
MKRCASLLLVGALPLLSCASGPSRPAPVTPAAKFELPEGARAVAAARGLVFTRPLAVQEITRAHMRHVVARQVGENAPDADTEEPFLKAFGFVGLEATVSPEATVRLYAEQLIGLYVAKDRAIYVRPSTREASSADEDTIVHEIEHALQDDVFGMSVLDSGHAGEDAMLARRAVYEGDATVVAWEVHGQREGVSPREAVARRRAGAAAGSAMLGAAQEMSASPQLAHATVLTRMETLFPYAAGSELAAEAYLAGGNALLDGLFRKLPISTAQVLHPDKYFAGVLPVPVAAPVAPAGYAVLARGTMGELRTRALLELGLPTERALTASDGWGGDAFAVLGRPDARYAVLWSTVWDDAAGAQRFASALEEATRCGDPPGKPCTLGASALKVQANRVAWTRGIDDPAQLDALLALPAPRPKNAPPHGRVVLSTDASEEEILVPAGGDPDLRVPHLGLRARLPRRFASIRLPSSDLAVQNEDFHGRGVLSHESKPFDPSSFPATAAQLAPVFATIAPLGPRTIAPVSLPAGQGIEARWSFTDGSGSVALIELPLCGGKQTLLVSRTARSEEARVALEQWVQSIEPAEPGVPAVCKEGKP